MKQSLDDVTPRISAAQYRANRDAVAPKSEPTKTVRAQPERALQLACVEWLAIQKPRCVVVHPANEMAQRMSDLEKMWAVKLGLVSGAADFLCLWSASMAIELKSDIGRQSADQKNFEAWCKASGVPYIIARTLDEFIACFVSRGLCGGVK